MKLESKQWDVSLNEEDFFDIVDTAGYGIGYWAISGVVDDDELNYTIKYFDGDERKKVTITPSMIELAIEKILNGTVQCSDAIKSYIRSDDIDADCADVIVQVAAFGEIVYG